MAFQLNEFMKKGAIQDQVQIPPIPAEVKNRKASKTEESLSANDKEKYEDFYTLCERVKNHIQNKTSENQEEWLKRQKRALLGYQNEVTYYKNEINDYLETHHMSYIKCPPWYDTLVEGIFHENWGLAGIYEWVKNGTSSSCKIIQPRIYFLENGRTVLKPQRLSEARYKALRKALLLNDTSQRENSDYQELYMVDGTRIEIYNNHKESSGEGIIVFRRYTVKDYSFEKMAEFGTIGDEAIPMLKHMVGCGYNVNMIGPVRSGKTTFLTTYQSYEDQTLEGVLVETDPEIPLHELMPSAPIMQLICDGDELDGLVKPLMRSDADYLIMGEARDGRALRLMLMLTKKGTRRVKATFHTGKAQDFCYDVAQEITNVYGGNIWAYMIQVATNFDFLFEFMSDPNDKSKKRLKGIHEIQFDTDTMEIRTNAICLYDVLTEKWSYNSNLSEKTRMLGMEENQESFELFETELKKLAKDYEMKENPVRLSPFSRLVPTSGDRND